MTRIDLLAQRSVGWVGLALVSEIIKNSFLMCIYSCQGPHACMHLVRFPIRVQ